MEDKDSPYANVLTVRPDNQGDPTIQELVKALNSDRVRKYIEDIYKGSIVPAFKKYSPIGAVTKMVMASVSRCKVNKPQAKSPMISHR